MFDEHMFDWRRVGGIVRVQIVNTPVVKARRRMAVVVLATIVLATVAIVVAPQAFAQDENARAGTSDTYVVAQGETLWSIATSLTPPGGDVRDTVATIKDMNMLDSASLDIGDQLIVPLAG